MSEDRTFERKARAWLELGPADAPDHVVEAALLEIETTTQERDLRIPWRFPQMTTPFRLATAAVIGVLAIGAGLMLFNQGNQDRIGVPTTAPSPTADAASTLDASLITSYSTIPGWIVFEHFGPALDGSEPERNDFDRRQIWLVKADGTGLHELAPGNPAEDGKIAPDISPDGRTVVFASWGPIGRILSVPIDGDTPTLLTTNCSGLESECNELDPAFSPEGTRIAFVQDSQGSEPSSVIGVRDLAAGTVTFIESTRVPLAESHVRQPTWSPDGNRIVYHLDTQGPTEDHPSKIRLWIVDTDGSGLVELPAPEGETEAADPDWSPDGSLIVFSSMANREGEGRGGSPGVFTIRPDGTNLTKLCGPCLQGGIAPTWTPDGEHILFFGYRTWALMDPDGKNAAHINQPKLTFSAGFYYDAVLQPTP
jgi:Tol biopolymer transport system component